TFMGNGLAIPHGTEEGKSSVIESGLSLIQIPEGVDFDGNEAKVVLGIAGKENEHLELLQKIAIIFSEEENAEKVINPSSAEEIIEILESEDDRYESSRFRRRHYRPRIYPQSAP